MAEDLAVIVSFQNLSHLMLFSTPEGLHSWYLGTAQLSKRSFYCICAIAQLMSVRKASPKGRKFRIQTSWIAHGLHYIQG